MSGLTHRDLEVDTFETKRAGGERHALRQTSSFSARHGIGHHISPTEVNYRANIFALKKIGVERIVSISACGSLREDYALGKLSSLTRSSILPVRERALSLAKAWSLTSEPPTSCAPTSHPRCCVL
jgi:hypothetical protein